MLSDERIQAFVDDLMSVAGRHRTTAPGSVERFEVVIRRHLAAVQPSHMAVAERVVELPTQSCELWWFYNVSFVNRTYAMNRRAAEVARVAAILAECFPERGAG